MNRIAEVAVATPLRNRFELESRLRQLDYKPAELAGALKDTFAVSPAKAVSLGRAGRQSGRPSAHRRRRVPTRTSGGPAMNQPTTLTDDVIDVLRVEVRNVKATLPPDTATDALLMTDLGLDSLDVVEFVARVEEVYRISVSDEDWQQLTTLQQIAHYVRTHR